VDLKMQSSFMILLLATSPVEEPANMEPLEAETETAAEAEAESVGAEAPVNNSRAEAAPGGGLGLPPGVELWDDSTWSDLTVEQKDKLRAERARRRAAGEEAPIRDAEDEVTSSASSDASSEIGVVSRPRLARAAPSRLESYWGEKQVSLRRLTIGFSVTWGVAIVASGVLVGVATREPKQEQPTDMSFGSSGSASVSNRGSGLIVGGVLVGMVGFVGMVGTLVSASMLGAHNNTKPLYFSIRQDGLTLRF
jgi:hypothetical protein